MKVLLNHGAEANVVDVNKSTPFHLASANGDMDIASLMLEKGANVDGKDKVTVSINEPAVNISLPCTFSDCSIFCYNVLHSHRRDSRLSTWRRPWDMKILLHFCWMKEQALIWQIPAAGNIELHTTYCSILWLLLE